jgi:hypothetical protein
MVRPLCKAGAVVVIVGYDLAPKVISWWSVLLVEENGVTRRKPLTCHKSLINFIT